MTFDMTWGGGVEADLILRDVNANGFLSIVRLSLNQSSS